MTHLFYLLLILSEYLIHDNGDSAIACYIAGGSETVHRNIKGYHKRLHIGIETQNGGERTERCHHGSSRYSRSSYHADGEHEDEVEEEGQIARQTIDETDGKRTAGNLHHRTREMDGGTERNGEAGNAVGNPVFQGLLQCYRNGGCRRRGAESREVGWQHIEQQLKRILVGQATCQQIFIK